MVRLLFVFFILVSQVSFSAAVAPKWELRTAPIALLARWVTLDLSYFVNENWAFGPSYIAYASPFKQGGMLAPTYNGKAVGAHVLWAESLTKESVYVGAHYHAEDYTSYPHSFLGHDDITGYKTSAVIGKRWIPWEGFSSMLGIGYENYNHEIIEVSDSGITTTRSDNSALFHIEYKFGYFF